MLYLMLTVFLTGVFVFLSGYILIFGERIMLARRVDQVVGSPAVSIREKELSAPFAERVIRPLVMKMTVALARALPSEKESAMAKKLVQAGLIERLKPVEALAVKYMLALLSGLGSLFVSGLLGVGLLHIAVILLCGVCAGLILPEYYLQARIRRRNVEVEATLPQVMDLLTVSVEAGLGFDGAVYKVIEKTKGVLAHELKRMMHEIKMGKPRREALKDLAERFGVKDLDNFVSAVILGEQLGISIGNVLRRQADQVRLRRRQNAEEKAMKAPVKMLFPLVFMIFPAIFIVILGPGAIQVYRSFIH
jgi:tight adherence protein C